MNETRLKKRKTSVECDSPNREREPVGLVGFGLMGRGIATCLLASGFRVAVHDCAARSYRSGEKHIAGALCEMVRRKLITPTRIRDWQDRFRVARKIEDLAGSTFLLESIQEDAGAKQETYERLEASVGPDAVIASNTSSIPISILQQGRQCPGRFIGMHWGEPAQIMRYLEIIPGVQTSKTTMDRTAQLGRQCGKDPAVLRRDIRGFVSNRMMYAMMREACHLVECGIADIETVDRSFRHDIGWWATLAGPFRWMDLTGIPAYATVMEDLFPQLSNSTEVPKLMRDAVKAGSLGISNAQGFYPYSPAEARDWEQAWVEFTYDIRKLAEKYERRLKP